MTALVFLRCDFCGVDAGRASRNANEARAALASSANPDAERWEHIGRKDACPACREAPEAVRHKTRLVNWLVVCDGSVLGHGVRRQAIVDAVKRDYGIGTHTGTPSKPLDGSGSPAVRLAPLDGGGRVEFVLECPDGIVLELISREVVEGYVELCDCGTELHLYGELPRRRIACWIDLSDHMRRDRYGLFLEGWAGRWRLATTLANSPPSPAVTATASPRSGWCWSGPACG